MIHHRTMCFEKAADTPAEGALLHHEVWVLGLAAHPGVVALAGGQLCLEGRTSMRTRAVPGRPLAAMDKLSAAEVAGLGAAIATTVADLHDAGITHGRLNAGHIIVDTAGRPVLCGFSGATAVTDSPAPAVSADVMALGHTLAAVLAVSGARPAERAVAAAPDRVSAALARLLKDAGARAGGRHGSARWLADRLGDDRWAPCLPSRPPAPVPG